MIRSIDNAKGSNGRPKTSAFAIPKSRVNAAICDVTINPAVDIIVIMTNINQKIGVRNISNAVKLAPGWLAAALAVESWGLRIGIRSPWAAMTPTIMKISP